MLCFLTGIDFTPRHRPLGVRQHPLPAGITGDARATTLASSNLAAVFMDEAGSFALTSGRVRCWSESYRLKLEKGGVL